MHKTIHAASINCVCVFPSAGRQIILGPGDVLLFAIHMPQDAHHHQDWYFLGLVRTLSRNGSSTVSHTVCISLQPTAVKYDLMGMQFLDFKLSELPTYKSQMQASYIKSEMSQPKNDRRQEDTSSL